MNIFKQEIQILKDNKKLFEGLLKRKEFNNNSITGEEVLALFDKLEQELLDDKSKIRNELILHKLPVLYISLFQK